MLATRKKSIGVLAPNDDLRCLFERTVASTTKDGGHALAFLADVHPGDDLPGAILLVAVERGVERGTRLALANVGGARRARLALLLVHREAASEELILLAEQEARQMLEELGFEADAARMPSHRAAMKGAGAYARLDAAALAAVLAQLACWTDDAEPGEAGAGAPGPSCGETDAGAPAPAAPSLLAAERAVLSALWPLARRSTMLDEVRLPDEAAGAAVEAFFAQFPDGGECCGQPRQRRMGIDLRRMLHEPPTELGAFAVYECAASFSCKGGQGPSPPYLVHHLAPERLDALGPPLLAACTCPRTGPAYGAPRSPTVLAPHDAPWLCACPESLASYWGEEGAALAAALRAWDPSAEEPVDALEVAVAALGLAVPIGERSGGPLRVQSGGWRSPCARCGREEHLVFQTQAFTADNTTFMWACPDHPEDASIFVARL